MRCSGKTTVGREVAERLGYAFVDTDIRMREESGLTVADVVSREGWPGFRQRENRALRAAVAPCTVVATGGGAVLDRDNRVFLRESGLCFYLSARAALLAERLRRDPEMAQRPALTEGTESPLSAAEALARELESILHEREALYREAAHHTVDAERTPEEVADRIISLAAFPARKREDGT
jgi:shikimate kinase